MRVGRMWLGLGLLGLCFPTVLEAAELPALPEGTRSLGVATGLLSPGSAEHALVAWVPNAGGEPTLGLFRQEGANWVEASRQGGLLSASMEGLGLALGPDGLAIRQAIAGGNEKMARFAGQGLPLVAAAARSPQGSWNWDASKLSFTSTDAQGQRQHMHELWALPGGGWGPALRMDELCEGQAADGRWAGPRDASAVLRVRRVNANLEVEAVVMDDRMTGGDMLALVLPGGQRKALGQRKAIPGGWQVNAHVPLAQLTQPRVGGRAANGDLLRQATFAVVDSDGPSPPTLLATGPAHGADLGRVRLRAKALPPIWGSCTLAELDLESGDPRP